MTLKERIGELFDQYSVNLSVVESEKSEMATAKLASGQEIMTDAEAFAEGVSVFVVNDENEQIPLPSGDYEMEDGQVLVVVDGVVESMAAAVEEVEEVVEEEELTEEAEMPEALTADMVKSMIQEAIAEIKSEFSTQIEVKEAQITELNKQSAEKGLPRAPKQAKQFTQVDLSKLDMKARIEAIQNQYSN